LFFRHDLPMRAEQAAALTNFLVILLIAGLTLAWSPSSGSTVVYAHPTKAAFQAAAMAVMVLAFVAAPLAALVSWRTWVHAQRVMAHETRGWQGVMEAGALGFALTLPFVLPGVVARQFNPGEWGQPQAFMLGLGYVAVYGLLGLIVGLVLGFLLWLSAVLVLRVQRRITS
jgi:hypothetical protein